MKGIPAVILGVALFPDVAVAYLDPGNGSFIFQLVLGFVFSVAIAFRTFWSRLIMFLSGLFGRKEESHRER